MAYVPFTNDYSSPRTPEYVAAETAALNARKAYYDKIFSDGNMVMGNLITECCSDPAYGGQGFYDESDPLSPENSTAAVPGTPQSIPPYALTPVDILTGTNGFPLRRDGRAWRRPRISNKYQRAQAAAYPNYGAGVEASRLVPPCPCFSNAPPVAIPVPTILTPTAAPTPTAPTSAPAPSANCPYPDCSTGNICLDLNSGCVLSSQVSLEQQEACALANYGVFGNMGLFVGDVVQGCQPLKFLGSPNLSPPQADPSMRAQINAVFAKRKGVSGLGQADGEGGFGGLLAVLAGAGILIWAMKK